MKNIKNYIFTNIFSLFGIGYFAFLLFNLFSILVIVFHSQNGEYEIFDVLYGFVVENLKYYILFFKISLILNFLIFIEFLLSYFFKIKLNFSDNTIYSFIFYFGFFVGYLPIVMCCVDYVIDFSYML